MPKFYQILKDIKWLFKQNEQNTVYLLQNVCDYFIASTIILKKERRLLLPLSIHLETKEPTIIILCFAAQTTLST